MGENTARLHLSSRKQLVRARQQGNKASATQKKRSEAGRIMLNQTSLPCSLWEGVQVQTEGVSISLLKGD